jgi:hypothetical protein
MSFIEENETSSFSASATFTYVKIAEGDFMINVKFESLSQITYLFLIQIFSLISILS